MKCANCWIETEDTLPAQDGGMYCEDCCDKLFVLCFSCLELVPKDSLVEAEIDGELEEVCKACAEAQEELK